MALHVVELGLELPIVLGSSEQGSVQQRAAGGACFLPLTLARLCFALL